MTRLALRISAARACLCHQPGRHLSPLGIALMLVLAGCGGGGESTASLTKAQFLKRGNAICVKGNEEIIKGLEAFSEEHPGGRISESLVNKADLKIVLPVREKEIRLLRALGAPSGQEEYVGKLLDGWEEGIERAEEDPTSLRKTGPGYAFWKGYSMSIHYGLIKCGLT